MKTITVRTPIFSFVLPLWSLFILAILMMLSLAVFYLSLAVGKSILPIGVVIDAVNGEGKAIYKIFVNKLRMPRTLLAFMAGGMLATAGYFMQLATKNPLASPTLTGVADGAALGAVFFLAFYSDAQGNMLTSYEYVPIFALVSGFAILGAVMGLNKIIKGGDTTFILIGITMAILCKATTSLLMMLSPIYRASQATVWLSGSVDGANLGQIAQITPFFLATVVILFLSSRLLYSMNFHETTVNTVGGDNKQYRWMLIVIAGAITAMAVSFAGPIGFVGILAPHMMRKLSPDSYGTIKALQILLLGGIIVLVGDLLGRTVVAPLQIPVGIMTSLFGGVVFLILFYQKKGTK